MEPDQARRLTRSLCMIAVDIYYVDEDGAGRLHRLCKEIKWQENYEQSGKPDPPKYYRYRCEGFSRCLSLVSIVTESKPTNSSKTFEIN